MNDCYKPLRSLAYTGLVCSSFPVLTLALQLCSNHTATPTIHDNHRDGQTRIPLR